MQEGLAPRSPEHAYSAAVPCTHHAMQSLGPLHSAASAIPRLPVLRLRRRILRLLRGRIRLHSACDKN